MDKLYITELIVCYAERATVAEGKLQALEECLNQLEIVNHQPPCTQHNLHLTVHTTRHTSQKLGFHPP